MFSLKKLRPLVLAIVIITSLPFTNADDTSQPDAPYQHGVVAADHLAASNAGVEILKQGGNVVDAAVATSFALSVVRPASCGVGGGGFMVIWDADKQQAVAIDYREKAPASATANMFITGLPPEDGSEPLSVRGGMAVAVPGHVAGLCYASKHYGRLPLKDVLQPAIRLAEQGVPVDRHDIAIQRSTLARIDRHNGYAQNYSELHQKYLNNGSPWQSQDRFYSPQLPLLRLIADHGADAFYSGPVADAIVSTVADHGGKLNHDDLSAMQPTIRPVLTGQFHDHKVVTMPPPSSGGVALLQMLNTLDQWQHQSGRSLIHMQHNSVQYTHVIAEAMKHAFADRAEYLGDADFVDVPVNRLISTEYAKQIAGKINLNKTLPSEQYGRFFAQSDAGTSHYSVMDAQGNAVACTETINLTYGSFVVVPEYGIVLNNEMDDFAAEPGKPNAFGLRQSAANAVAAGKKPLSSMTPTILVMDGRAVYATGASGGPRIISATLQSILNHTLFDMSPSQSVNSPRFHHQWFPNHLVIEQALAKRLSDQLQQKGHDVQTSSGLAAAQAAGGNSHALRGGSDSRKHGQPAGY